MSRSSAKAEKIRVDRDRLLAEGKHYEALQLYKTAVSRARTAKRWSEAEEMAADGAAALLRSGGADGASCGGELAAALVELWTKSGAGCGLPQVRSVLYLAALFPAPVAGADTAKDACVIFLKVCLKFSTSAAPNGAATDAGCPDFHLLLARRLAAMGDYSGAHLHYLRAGGAQAEHKPPASAAISEHAALLLNWSSPSGGGLQAETELQVTRAVLQYLCVEDLASATELLRYLTTRDPSLAAAPLLHFCEFLAATCQRSSAAAPLFDLLRSKYAPALARDPHLDAYLERIGELYFGRQQAKSFFDSMISALGPANARGSADSSRLTAAAAQAQPDHDAHAQAATQQQQQQQQQPHADEHMAPAPDVD